MKRAKLPLFAAALLGVALLTSFDYRHDPYGGYKPYFMERSELEKSVFYAPGPRRMANPGKIWVSGNGATIYVVERYKGVHIIDNSIPANPAPAKFIVAPGCMDVAIKDNILYLDNAVDLVAFDLAAGSVTQRLRNYFPEPAHPEGQLYHNDTGLVLVGWRETETDK
jgi:hypothetical protein